MNLDKIIEKAKKILSRTHSANEHEASLAMSKVYELLNRHDLEMKDIQGAIKSGVTEKTVLTYGRRTIELNYILPLLPEFFQIKVLEGCQWVRGKRHAGVILVGRPHRIEIAEYMLERLLVLFKKGHKELYDSLIQNLSESEKKKVPMKARNKIKRSYYYGFSAGIYVQLKHKIHNIQEETGLVPVKDPELEEYMESQDIEVKKNNMKHDDDSIHEDVFSIAFQEGRKAQVNDAINEQESLVQIGTGKEES